MIRIDEIYNNVFLAALQDQTKETSIHWFDPYGSTSFDDIHSFPKVTGNDSSPNQRILFWDQEPFHRDRLEACLPEFLKMFWWGDRHIIVTSEYNSKDVQWVHDTYGLESSYYFFHGWAALDWYRGYNHSYLMQPFKDRQLTHTFLCPNNIIGGKRKHRLALFSELVKRKLIHNNLVSFPASCPYENKTVKELCHYYNIHLDEVTLPLKIDDGNNYHSNSHCVDMWSLANQSLLHVVTETVYYGQKNHLTEKTFKPIVMQQPFVLVSCQGSLEYLRMYGFKTFNDFWSEDYDNANDEQRILEVSKLLENINNLSVKEKQDLQKHLTPIVEHNYNWFYSREFEQLLWNELQTMIKSWY